MRRPNALNPRPMPNPGLILAAGAALLAMALLAMEFAAASDTAPLPPTLTRAMTEAGVPAAAIRT